MDIANTTNSLNILYNILNTIVSKVYTECSALKCEYGWTLTKDSLNEYLLSEHICINKTRGVYPISPGSSTTRCAVIDMDDHCQLASWDDKLTKAYAIKDKLAECGFPSQLFRSSGGHGIHVIMLWEHDQDSRTLKSELKTLLKEIGFEVGTKRTGILENYVEVFPKQNEVRIGQYGNQFALPLSNKSRWINNGQIIENDDIKDGMFQWAMCRDIAPKIDEIHKSSNDSISKSLNNENNIISFTDIDRRPISITKEAIIRTLKEYPCTPDMSYEEWNDVGKALHHQYEGRNEGLELWDAWSENEERYKEGACAQHWRSFDSSKDNAIRFSTILFRNKQAKMLEVKSEGLVDADADADADVEYERRLMDNKIKETADNTALFLGRPSDCRWNFIVDPSTGELYYNLI